MYPDIFSVGRFTVHSYGLFLAIGFIFGILRMAKISEKYNLSKDIIYDLGICIVLAGIVGSRLLYVLCNLQDFTIKEIFSIWEGGLSFQGGIVLGIIVGCIFAKIKKINIWTILDILCPSVCIGYGITRIGCFLNGCCYGIESHLPWAVPMKHNGHVLMCEPVQLYSCILSFLMFYILTKFEFKSKIPGLVFNMYIILYGVYRFLIEFLRHHVSSDYIIPYISGGQALSILMILAGLILYYYRFQKIKQNNIL